MEGGRRKRRSKTEDRTGTKTWWGLVRAFCKRQNKMGKLINRIQSFQDFLSTAKLRNNKAFLSLLFNYLEKMGRQKKKHRVEPRGPVCMKLRFQKL